MKSYVRYMLAFSLLAAAPLAAQNGRAGADSARGARWERGNRSEARPAFERLIARRQELQLTDAQVTRLQEIGRRLEERNAPFRAQLATQREQFMAQRRAQMERLTPEQRRDTLRAIREKGRRETPEAMRVPMEQMRENMRVAMQEAQTVLTPQQKERARQLMAESRKERGRDGAEGRQRRGRGEQARGGTLRQ